MKKIITLTLALLLVFSGVVYSQTDELPDPGRLPDSRIYFLSNWAEGIGTFFTFGSAKKADRFLELSERRLAEANALIEKGEQQVAERTLEKYEDYIDRAMQRAERVRGEDTDDVLTRVSEATLRHQEILSGVYERVPEEAKHAIEKAMERGARGHEEAVNALSQERREEVMERVRERRQEAEERMEEIIDERVTPSEEDLPLEETPLENGENLPLENDLPESQIPEENRGSDMEVPERP